MNQGYYDSVRKEGKWPSIIEAFNASAAAFPSRIAFSIYEGKERREYTYEQVSGYIRNTALYMQEAGVEEGDRVLLIGKNSPAWATGYLSIQAIGAVVVPLDVFSTPEKVEALGLFSSVKGMIADVSWLEKMKGTPFDASLTFRISLEETRDTDISL